MLWYRTKKDHYKIMLAMNNVHINLRELVACLIADYDY